MKPQSKKERVLTLNNENTTMTIYTIETQFIMTLLALRETTFLFFPDCFCKDKKNNITYTVQ